MDRLTYVWAVYTIAWGLIFLYTVLLGRRQAGIKSEIEMLRNAISKKEK